MQRKKDSIMDKVHLDLLMPPHIVGTLIDLVVDEWRPDPSQQEDLVTHFVACPYCRTTFIAVLSAVQRYEKLHDASETPIDDVLMRFVTIHHEIEAQGYEQMGAYAEAIIAEGREKANKHFPILAEHIRRCPSCQSSLEATLAFLNESKETH